LRVHLCPLAELAAESALGFEVLDAKRAIVERGTAVPAALPALPRTELVLDPGDVLLLESVLPRIAGARLRAALPALAEPALLGDIERAFVAASEPDAQGRATLAVVDRSLLRRALELFARLKIRPASVTPAPLSMPLGERRWRLKLAGACASLRIDQRFGLCCSHSGAASPPVELQLALAQRAAERPDALEVQGESPDTEAWSALLGIPVVTVPAHDTHAPPVALELLQYELAPRMLEWAAWRVPAALAAALALVWLAGLNLDAWLMIREERALRARMDAELREAFPRTTVVLDPLAQMRRGVADLRAGAGTGDAEDFLPLAASVARALDGEAEAVRVVEYRDRALQLRFDARALDSPKKRELVLERLAQAGLAGRFSESTLNVRRRGAL
jgi:general secretion pathway protein L